MTGHGEDPFVEAFGPPVVEARPMRFDSVGLDHMMARRYERIGAGWYLGRMFHLFGSDLEWLDPCVDAWSFLLPPPRSRWIAIGYNVYGCILLLDGHDLTLGTVCPVGMLDPLSVTFVTDPTLYLYSLLDDWLPGRKLDSFLDTSVYMEFVQAEESLLDDDEILGIRRPLSLGGAMELSHFARMNIVEYYQLTGPVYAAAFQSVMGSDTAR